MKTEHQTNVLTPPQLQQIAQIVTPLLYWYQANARDLPWRREPTPYHVWVSEVMLQQTRVEAVKPYYERFLAAFPDIAALAAAPQEQLMKLWQGLGYYSRARNLQKGACTVQEEFGGVLPKQPQLLLRIPGIGPYTAGAIASIAYGLPAPAIDGNVVRVLARLLADTRYTDDPQLKPSYHALLKAIYPREADSAFTQALMELGAVICMPNGAPHCTLCPLQQICQARQTGQQLLFPKKKPRAPRKAEDKTVFLLRWQNGFLLQRQPEHGLLAGLYLFLQTDGHFSQEKAHAYLRSLGLHTGPLCRQADTTHIFTHREWHMQCFSATVLQPPPMQTTLICADRQALQSIYAVPSAHAVYLQTALTELIPQELQI